MYATDRGPKNAAKWSWTPTNPQGFAKWLADRGRFRLTQHVTKGHNIRLDVDPFPAYERINPLQGAIQIMKRDRDRKYGTNEQKPISVIIATLAGHVAREGDEIEHILTKMADQEWRNGITSVGGKTRNPESSRPEGRLLRQMDGATRETANVSEVVGRVARNHEGTPD